MDFFCWLNGHRIKLVMLTFVLFAIFNLNNALDIKDCVTNVGKNEKAEISGKCSFRAKFGVYTESEEYKLKLDLIRPYDFQPDKRYVYTIGSCDLEFTSKRSNSRPTLVLNDDVSLQFEFPFFITATSDCLTVTSTNRHQTPGQIACEPIESSKLTSYIYFEQRLPRDSSVNLVFESGHIVDIKSHTFLDSSSDADPPSKTTPATPSHTVPELPPSSETHSKESGLFEKLEIKLAIIAGAAGVILLILIGFSCLCGCHILKKSKKKKLLGNAKQVGSQSTNISENTDNNTKKSNSKPDVIKIVARTPAPVPKAKLQAVPKQTKRPRSNKINIEEPVTKARKPEIEELSEKSRTERQNRKNIEKEEDGKNKDSEKSSSSKLLSVLPYQGPKGWEPQYLDSNQFKYGGPLKINIDPVIPTHEPEEEEDLSAIPQDQKFVWSDDSVVFDIGSDVERFYDKEGNQVEKPGTSSRAQEEKPKSRRRKSKKRRENLEN